MRAALSAVVLALFLSACGVELGTGTGGSVGIGTTITSGASERREEHFVNGKAAAAYYSQFVYSEQLNEKGEKRYRYLGSRDARLGKGRDGKPLRAGIELFLLRNGTFKLFYSEMAGEGAAAKPVTGSERRLEGSWWVEGTRLIVGEAAVGDGIVFNDAESVALRFNRDLHASGLIEAPVLMSPVVSTAGIEFEGRARR
jgi:hypothetical protein